MCCIRPDGVCRPYKRNPSDRDSVQNHEDLLFLGHSHSRHSEFSSRSKEPTDDHKGSCPPQIQSKDFIPRGQDSSRTPPLNGHRTPRRPAPGPNCAEGWSTDLGIRPQESHRNLFDGKTQDPAGITTEVRMIINGLILFEHFFLINFFSELNYFLA